MNALRECRRGQAGGLAIFARVLAAGSDPAAGSPLTFATSPGALESISTGLRLDAILFGLLFLAALSSSIGRAKLVTAALREQWSGMKSATATLPGIGLIVLVGLSSALSDAMARAYES
ncbi:MAG: hypothetical protein ACQEVT_12770 [Pseudomonadota bacterium]|uniref:hypothetical protein n=1 Tax=Roseovarius TaxID=74030 RepID=UPI0022A861BD|nr:hypothetical protein [Roseovarius sp. EGI FJ00037]MCZ0812142.1 hypothetical protein [Roseovarius sp. EGI FJ00037]